ncbi:uncharacterized protein LOC131224999 [Magnolia sinica]|uniref:uncharacterized protein LOC131224999 n=1 Tax=Magnolia sinica TaxID=86752 RepID=UPI002658C103|nr:uncharacterized protein LOC131224999 [Magnolia sinica]
MFNERDTLLKEKEQFKREKDLFFEEKEKLANEREEFNKEKEGTHTQKGHFVMEEGEELRNRGEVNIDDKEPGYEDLGVQSYSNAKGNVLNASTSHPVYERRAKRISKPSYYKMSPYLSLSAFDTTHGSVPEPNQVTAFATSPIPFPLHMDPFRALSAHEVKEVDDWYEANKDIPAWKWFSTIWMKDAWVDSEAIDTYIEFLEKRHNDLSITYRQDCKFCPTYFTQSLEGCLPVLIAYRASKSASERASLIGQLTPAYAIAKQRDKPYAKAIWCYERVYAPINYENSHWFLLVIYPRAREIVVVDSLCTNVMPKYKQQMKNMTDALPILFHATGDSTALEGKNWSVRVDESAPKQHNGYDCGIFVMKFIDILCSGLTLAGTDMQKFTADWRKSIAYDCLSLVRR